MARPVVTETAEEAYAGLGPWAEADEAAERYHLLHLVAACTEKLHELNELVRESDDGRPGWSSLVDVDRARREYLPWLAQLVGVTIPPNLSEPDERAAIKGAVGFRRGTKAAIAGAAQPFLTGTRVVQIVERDGSPYRLTVRTFARETPNQARVGEALQAAKPAGLILTYEVLTGQTYGELKATGDTYEELGEKYATYFDMKTSVPPVI